MLLSIRLLTAGLLVLLIYNGAIWINGKNTTTTHSLNAPIRTIEKQPKPTATPEQTMAFIDSLSPRIRQTEFSLNGDKISIRSQHLSEQQWLITMEKVLAVARQQHLLLHVVSCSFLQQGKQLVSQCEFKPMMAVK